MDIEKIQLPIDVTNFLGVGRFVLGLPDEIKVVYLQVFKVYQIES